MPRALVTGISGQDGSYLGGAAAPTAATRSSAWCARPRRGASPDGVVGASPATCCDPATLRAAVHDARPDELYHLAAPTFVPDSWEDPTETVAAIATATATLLAAARDGRPGACASGSRPRARSSATRGRARRTSAARCARARRTARRSSPRTGSWARCASACGLFACSGLTYNHESPRRPRALPPAQGHARRGGDQARPRAQSSCSAISTRSATGRTPPTSCGRAWLALAGRRARRLRVRLRASGAPCATSSPSRSPRSTSIRPVASRLIRRSSGRPSRAPLVGNPAKARRELGWEPDVHVRADHRRDGRGGPRPVASRARCPCIPPTNPSSRSSLPAYNEAKTIEQVVDLAWSSSIWPWRS